jgi:NhaA family Na+:H+ antiporter
VVDGRRRTWAASDRFIPKRFVRPFVRFTKIEASSGIVLLAAAIAAIIWANSGMSNSYFEILDTHLTIEWGSFHFDETVHDLVNDGLMAIFFFVVGLEIKREIVLGDLREPRAAALPVMAALGGMIVPALIYVLVNAGAGGEALQGWGIPMATDIAFAVGIVALLGSRVPPGAKLFILALAIADDLGAIAVIAIFYTADLDSVMLVLAILGLGLIWVAQKIGIRSLIFYVPAALVIWYLTLESGVHATLAGVAIAFLTPARPLYKPKEFDERTRAIIEQYPLELEGIKAQEHADHEALLLSDIANESVSPLNRLEYSLLPWSSFFVVPVFALANTGIDFGRIDFFDALTSSVSMGVALGLVVGKTVGISIFTLAAVRLGLGRLPANTTWRHIIGLSMIAGIGFTVSLFIAGLAFQTPLLIDQAKVGIFVGSLVAGIAGAVYLLGARSSSDQ